MARRGSRASQLASSASQATSAHEVKLQIKAFLDHIEGNSLRTWLQYFDQNNDQKLSYGEFHMGMLRLNFTGDTKAIFEAIDQDGSGEISLEEIDMASAMLWVKFRKWCLELFQNSRDMLQRLLGTRRLLDKEAFAEGIRAHGWQGGMEDILFFSVDMDNTGHISLSNLKWFANDKKRQLRKKEAKARSRKANVKKIVERRAAEALLRDFKQHLRLKYGSYTRAWRRCLDVDGSMSVQKHEALKACCDIGWPGNVRLLWKALDRDEGGVVHFEELDPHSAEQLAHFRLFLVNRFGGAEMAFKAFDKQKQHKLRKPEFLSAITEAGFEFNKKGLFEGLDWKDNKYIVVEDILFLDAWRPSAFLSAEANPLAMAEFKHAFLNYYSQYLRGWRQMDQDCSNRVSWAEFEKCCQTIGFKGDAPGAWRALDKDLSGYITLHEVDEDASNDIMNFKIWADEEFGGVRAAFGVFDSDQSGELSYAEFRRSCRSYGFEGDVRLLFQALDVATKGVLSHNELSFLDAWEIPGDEQAEAQAAGVLSPGRASASDPGTVRFATETPGPGAYNLPATHQRGVPRLPPQELSPEGKAREPRMRLPQLQEGVSPAQYEVMQGLQQASWVRAKPKYSFGRSSRPSNEQIPRRGENPGSQEPGPGYYAPVPPSKSVPRHSFTSRRPIVLHPLSRSEN